MVQKKKTRNGLIYYEIDHDDQLKLIISGAFGNKCDSCYKTIDKVYYIPVLNWGMCEECFQDWQKRAIKYEEDEWFVKENVKWIEEEFEKCGVQLRKKEKKERKT